MNDPILSGIVSCLQASYYEKLKRKGRILVKDSANLLGVVDQTGTLGPNEVFIQIQRNQKDEGMMIKIVNDLLSRESPERDISSESFG